jgi:hypothetical protein
MKPPPLTQASTSGEEAILRVGREEHRQPVLACAHVYQAFYDFLIGGDGREYFYVIRWQNRLWVVEESPAADTLVADLILLGAPNRKLNVINIPWQWRNRVFGFLPLFPLVRSGDFSLSTMPKEFTPDKS